MVKQCFKSTGPVAEGDIPCDPNAEVSACCGEGSVCVTNLACVDWKGNYIPGTCTTKTWGDILPPECPCPPWSLTVDSTLDYRDSFVRCQDGSICCGNDNAACCAQGKGHAEIDYRNLAHIPSNTAQLSTYYEGVQPITLPITSSTSAASTSTSALPTPSVIISTLTLGAKSQTAPPAASNVKLEPVVLPTTAKVGIGIGVAAAVLLLIAAVVLLWYRRQRPPQVLYQSTDETPHGPFIACQPPQELWGSEAARELQGSGRVVEVEGSVKNK